ncbi:MAG: response regulator [Bacteroidales bacterium]|nr:response regulator [Bacteroidales bacterium]
MKITRAIDILLIEDNPNDVELTLLALKSNKLAEKIQVIRDGEEALEYLFCTGSYASRDQSDLPRLILLDLKLPKVGGIEVLEKIKSDNHLKLVPVVVLTTSKVERDLIQSYHLGVNSYIVKPVDYQMFISIIAEISQYWLSANELPN